MGIAGVLGASLNKSGNGNNDRNGIRIGGGYVERRYKRGPVFAVQALPTSGA
jgi:hypothetical protein